VNHDNTLLDDLPIGITSFSQGRTITNGDLALLNSLVWVIDESHQTTSSLCEGREPDRVLTGPALIAVAVGLSRTSRIFQLVGNLANMHLLVTCSVSATYREPIRVGDTLRVRTTLADAALHPDLERVGTLLFHENVYKFPGSLAVEIQRRILFDRIVDGEPWDFNTCWSAVHKQRRNLLRNKKPS
jgi:hypothetical protein